MKEVTSTNDYMLSLLSGKGSEVEEGTYVYADTQTKGRGQGKNTWESEPGRNLTGTLVLFPDFLPAGEQFLITQAMALGVADFLHSFAALDDLSVKWPNDIYWRDFKICGILNEAQLMGHSINYVLVGAGVNINQRHFVSDAPNPVSVYQITHREFSIDEAAVALHSALMNRYMQLVNGETETIRSGYADKLYRKSGLHGFVDEAGPFNASIVKVHPAGEIELRRESGETRSYLFKQVEFVVERKRLE